MHNAAALSTPFVSGCPTMTHPPRNDITRTTLAVLLIGALIVASGWLLPPFLTPAIWATMIVVTTWPLLRGFEVGLLRRRAPAAAVMTLLLLLLLLLFVVPLMLAIVTIVGDADEIVDWAKALTAHELPPPPWMGDLPLVGERLKPMWEQAVAYTLLVDWTRAGPSPEATAPGDEAARAVQHGRESK